jgi:uncharacterized protein YjdB
MNSRKTSINIGFKNCVFLSRNSHTIERIINDKVSDTHVAWTAQRPISVKVEKIDALHDKLSLGYDNNENVEGTITWRKSANDKHFVFVNFE